MAEIVVGVDGSEGARRALEFAASEARRKQAHLRIVSAWHVPTMAYAGGVAPPIDPEGFREGAEKVAQEAAAKAAEAAGDVEVETIVEEGQPADVLLEAARDAELLVVGSRGLGGFRGLLLGSVSQQCAHHASCPVVIVPTGERKS
jgi:nucleotide-binding universal stress UspA family protein